MSSCLICHRPVVFGGGGLCLRCWDASEHFAANTDPGLGTHRSFLEALRRRLT